MTHHFKPQLDLLEDEVSQHWEKLYLQQQLNEYDQEIPQSQTADNPVAP